MKCWYCRTNLGSPYYHGVPAPVILVCEECPSAVEYYFGLNETVYRAVYGCTINDKKYSIYIEPEEDMKFSLYHIRGNLAFPIVRSETVPNINPTNVEEKVRTYLIFS